MLLSDPAAIEAIAKILNTAVEKAPFVTEKGEPAYEMALHSQEFDQPLRLILWPSLGRVDVRGGQSTWALRDVSDVYLLDGGPIEAGGLMTMSRFYPQFEVLFRRQRPPAFLLVSRKGGISLVA